MTPTTMTRSHHRRPPAGTKRSMTTSPAATTPRIPRVSDPRRTRRDAKSSPPRWILNRWGNTADEREFQDLWPMQGELRAKPGKMGVDIPSTNVATLDAQSDVREPGKKGGDEKER